MTIFVTLQLIVTLDSIRNSCDVYDMILITLMKTRPKYFLIRIYSDIHSYHFFDTNIFGYLFVLFFGYKYIRIFVRIENLYSPHPDSHLILFLMKIQIPQFSALHPILAVDLPGRQLVPVPLQPQMDPACHREPGPTRRICRQRWIRGAFALLVMMMTALTKIKFNSSLS